MGSEGTENDLNVPLLDYNHADNDQYPNQRLLIKVWIETKKIWAIVGPEIFSCIASYSMMVVSQALAGHLGTLELAAMSIATSVICAFNFGLLLGMASALETLCGQAFGAKKYHMLGIYLQCSWIVLLICCVIMLPMYIFATPFLKLLGQAEDIAELAGFVAIYLIPLHFSFAFAFPLQRFLQSQLKNNVNAMVNLVALVGAHIFELDFCVQASVWIGWCCYLFEYWTVAYSSWITCLHYFWWLPTLGLDFSLKHFLIFGGS